jgi:hypothetical protein
MGYVTHTVKTLSKTQYYLTMSWSNDANKRTNKRKTVKKKDKVLVKYGLHTRNLCRSLILKYCYDVFQFSTRFTIF